MSNQKNNYLFILGRETLLSLAELLSLLKREEIDYQILSKNESKVILETKQPLDLDDTIKKLGGTIKIGKFLSNIGNSPEKMAATLNEEIPQGKIEFSINGSKFLGIETKKILKRMNRSARYIESKNSATIIYNGLVKKGADIEIIDGNAYISKAIQSIDQFSSRDFGRPGRDDLSGMLPPKLAMMMINLAQIKTDKKLYDPFCGSGTIITEAMLMNYTELVGSDLSEKAIADTKTNIQWIKTSFSANKNINPEIFPYDSTQISQKITSPIIDAIVTEPYLGKPLKGNEPIDKIQIQANELKNLYLKSFKEFHKILKTGGIIIFVVPRFKTKDEWVKIDCESEIKKIGFINEPILEDSQMLFYWRESQHVGREIWRFKKV
jgi:tRNA G10  N-methylase Trm11